MARAISDVCSWCLPTAAERPWQPDCSCCVDCAIHSLRISERCVVAMAVATILAGFDKSRPGKFGPVFHADGKGQVALFDTPVGVALDFLGFAYIVDRRSHCVRKMS